MQDGHVHVFDTPHMSVRDLDIELRQRSEFPSVSARQRNCDASEEIAVFHCSEHVGRISGAADRDYYIAWLGEVL